MNVFLKKNEKDVEFSFAMEQPLNFNSPVSFRFDYSPMLYLDLKNPIFAILDGGTSTEIIMTKLFLRKWLKENEDKQELDIETLTIDFLPAYIKRMKDVHMLFKNENGYFFQTCLYLIQGNKVFMIGTPLSVKEITNQDLDGGLYTQGLLHSHKDLSPKEKILFFESTMKRNDGMFNRYPIVYGNFPSKSLYFKEFNGNIKEVSMENFIWR